MEAKYNVRVFINRPKVAMEGEDPSGQVQARVRWKNNEVGFTVGCYANTTKWNHAGQCAVKHTTHYHLGKPSTATSINYLISKTIDSIKRSFTRFSIDNIIPTSEELKNAVINELCSDDEVSSRRRKKKAGMALPLFFDERKTIYDYFQDFLNEGRTVHFWSDDVVEKVAALKNHWIEIDPKKQLKPKDITVEVMQHFQMNLVRRGLRNSTSAKWIKTAQWFLKFCKKKGAGVSNDVLQFKSSLTDVRDKEIIFLTWDEFKTLHDFTIPPDKKHLEVVRDMFIFSCTTGLRYSDVAALKRENIVNDVISVVTEKTDHLLRINLNRFSREIIEKYRMFPPQDGKAMLTVSNQKCNVHIKELCQMAGIDAPVTIAYRIGNKTYKSVKPKYEVISFHSGRRTFVSLALKLGATAEEVRRITGHHSYSVMEKYMAQDDEQRKHATAVFDIKTEREFLYDQLNNLTNKQLREMIIQYNNKYQDPN